MSGTLYATNLLQTGAGFMTSCLVGILFGLFLEQAGFGSSRRLTGIFYFRDMTVLKVMFTAIAVALIGYHYVVGFGWLAPEQIYMLDTYWPAQVIGGLVFGAGFVIGGWCPGTALVGIASARLDALVFLGGVALGSIFFNELFTLIRPIYEGMHGGTLFLYDSLNLAPKTAIFFFSLVAVAAFMVSSLVETRFGRLPKAPGGTWKRHGIAAAVLILFAGGLFLTPDHPPVTSAGVPRPGYLMEIARAEDHMDPTDLADLIMKGDPNLIVVDLRSPEAFRQFHLRGAINIPLERLSTEAGHRLTRDRQIILYSNGTTHAAQAWLEMRHWGWSNVKVLMDGLLGFWRDCLTPPSLSGPTDQAVSGDQRSVFASRRLYFLEQADQ